MRPHPQPHKCTCVRLGLFVLLAFFSPIVYSIFGSNLEHFPVDGVGESQFLFSFVFHFHFLFLRFLRFPLLFFVFLRFFVLLRSSLILLGQGQPTAIYWKIGNFTATPSAPTPFKTSRSDFESSDPRQL